MDPACKLTYFIKWKWDQEWIDTAVDIAREVWEEDYKSQDRPPASRPTNTISGDDIDDILASLDAPHTDSEVDFFDEYISTPPMSSIHDPLAFWASQAKTSKNSGWKMGVDYLSANATVVDGERAFSRGGRVVSKLRHRLSDRSIRASTVLGSWLQHGGILDDARMIEHFDNKEKRGKNKD